MPLKSIEQDTRTIWERTQKMREVRIERLLLHLDTCGRCAHAVWVATEGREKTVGWPDCEEGRELLRLALYAREFPSGIDVILSSECPVGAESPMTCMVCEFGHMTECHYPDRCAEAQCGHFQEALEAAQ